MLIKPPFAQILSAPQMSQAAPQHAPHQVCLGGPAEAARRAALLRKPDSLGGLMAEPPRRAPAWYDHC